MRPTEAIYREISSRRRRLWFMVSSRMSRIEAAAGRGAKVDGRKGGRWRQSRTARGEEMSQRVLQRAASSIMIRRVERFRSP